MDGYITTKQAAEMWNVSIRQIQNYCKKEIIPGVIKVGTNYLIPEDASRPKYGFYSNPSSDKKE